MPSITLSILALATALGSPASIASTQQPMPQAQTVKEYVESYYADEPVLADIAACESHMRQFDKDGNVLKNPNSSAVGIMQIMSSIHSAKADKLGIDITTIQGNLAYARYLYEEQGTTPWNASKSCWGQSKTSKDLAINK